LKINDTLTLSNGLKTATSITKTAKRTVEDKVNQAYSIPKEFIENKIS